MYRGIVEDRAESLTLTANIIFPFLPLDPIPVPSTPPNSPVAAGVLLIVDGGSPSRPIPVSNGLEAFEGRTILTVYPPCSQVSQAIIPAAHYVLVPQYQLLGLIPLAVLAN